MKAIQVLAKEIIDLKNVVEPLRDVRNDRELADIFYRGIEVFEDNKEVLKESSESKTDVQKLRDMGICYISIHAKLTEDRINFFVTYQDHFLEKNENYGHTEVSNLSDIIPSLKGAINNEKQEH